mmetsp:Transcript_113876/g.322440  ORF Transcript_113876/g.322440 Transcript_113876/m.322440 type:complete len:174 (+) Transcript_113876:95-616(+)
MGRRKESRSVSSDRGRRKRSDSRDGGRRKRRGGSRDRHQSTLDRFIEENELNESAAARLRGTSQDVREQVMEQGWNVIDNSRNASAVVITRIRKYEEGGADRARSPVRSGGGPGGGAADYRDGDWYCDACGAHNFARRNECFKCNAPRDGGRRASNRSRSRSRRRDRRDSRRR